MPPSRAVCVCVGQRALCFPYPTLHAQRVLGLHVWCPFMQTHSLSSLHWKRKEKKGGGKRGMRANMTAAVVISLFHFVSHTPQRLSLLICAIPAANYIHSRHPSIITSTCCIYMDPSGLHHCRLSVCLCLSGKPQLYYARCSQKEGKKESEREREWKREREGLRWSERLRAPLLLLYTRWSNSPSQPYVEPSSSRLTIPPLQLHLRATNNPFSPFFFYYTTFQFCRASFFSLHWLETHPLTTVVT